MELPARSVKPEDSAWSPNCDVVVSKERVIILVELAGLRAADLEITMQENRLQIQGNRQRPGAETVNVPSIGEVKFGRFQAVLEMPPGFDLAQAKAAYSNGFLRIEVPAAEGTTSPGVL